MKRSYTSAGLALVFLFACVAARAKQATPMQTETRSDMSHGWMNGRWWKDWRALGRVALGLDVVFHRRAIWRSFLSGSSAAFSVLPGVMNRPLAPNDTACNPRL